MNRQIKFRGKTRANGHWVYGSLVVYSDGATTIVNKKSNPWVDPSTIGQFTGLKDCKGVDVYEGDIVRISTRMKYDVKEAQDNLAGMIGIQPPKWSYGGEEIARVSYFDCAFHFIFIDSFMPDGKGRQEPILHYLFGERHPDAVEYYNTEIEVIGNIHDDKIKEE